MKKNRNYYSHNELKAQLKLMRNQMSCMEKDIKLDVKTYLPSLTKRLFKAVFARRNDSRMKSSNPIGKGLSNTMNKTLLKKENFMVKLLTNFFFKQIGKKIETKLLQ